VCYCAPVLVFGNWVSLLLFYICMCYGNLGGSNVKISGGGGGGIYGNGANGNVGIICIITPYHKI
jgi:hypothetical protein